MNPNDFNLATDFPLDKVIYSRQDSLPMPTGVDVVSIAHGLPCIPLVFGNWSTDSQFDTAYNYNGGTIPAPIGFLYGLSINIGADSTNIYLTRINATGGATTIYYRIYAFEPADSTVDLAFTGSELDSFVINTDYNYTKLFINDSVAVPSSAPITIDHNLGYYPQVMAWQRDKYSGWITPTVYGTYYPNGDIEVLEVEVKTDSIIITRDLINDSVDRVYYRIYADTA